MNRKLIFLLIVIFTLGLCSAGYASEGDFITLEQARSLAGANSRNLAKYEINVKKAQNQLLQKEEQRSDIFYEYDTMIKQYDSLYEQYYSLQTKLNEGDTSVISLMDDIQARISSIEKEMKTEYEKVKSSSDDIENAEISYDDAVIDRDNFKKQLQYNVEELYVSILNQEEALLIANKEYELKQSLLNMERIKLQLGSSKQQKVDQLTTDISGLKKRIIEQSSQIKTKKGKLNDMMGRVYSDELILAPFDVPETVEVPEYDYLLSKAVQQYNTLNKLKREIEQDEDDLDDESDYYRSVLLDLQIEEKKLQLEDEENKLDEAVSNLLADLEAKQGDYRISLIDFKNAKNSFEWDQKRFEMGHISKLALMESELSCLNAKNKTNSAGYALYLAERAVKLAESGIL
jgi:outer membrane protein TolC